MRLYAGFDLHSSNTYLGIVDEDGKRVFKKKLSNDREVILNTLAPYKDSMAGPISSNNHSLNSITRSWRHEGRSDGACKMRSGIHGRSPRIGRGRSHCTR